MNANFDTIYNDYNGGVSEANLANSAVTTDKIASSAVTTAKIANGAVTAAKLALGIQTASTTNTGNTTSTSYTATLTGSPGTNPSVTVTVPSTGMILLLFGAVIASTVADKASFLGWAASGTNTIAGSDANSTYTISPTAGGSASLKASLLLTGLTPGSTTFELQYRTEVATTGAFSNRTLSAIPLG